MKIRKPSKPRSYTVEMVNDTLVETRTVVEEVIDTLFAKVEEKKIHSESSIGHHS